METQLSTETTGRDVPKYVPPEPEYMGLAGLLSREGRVGRKTFWIVLLWTIAGYMAGVVAATFVLDRIYVDTDGGVPVMRYAFLALFLWLVAANCVKRVHDADKSGWTAFLLLIPIINFFVLIGIGSTPGTDGPNRFGPRAQRIRFTS